MQRGAFILFEGVDRCGKTTQSKLLVEELRKRGHKADRLNFPDRTTPLGKIIDSYLRNGINLDDRALHLLFSANRWEASASIKSRIESGETLIVDRYAFSGVAFSAAKGLDLEWCKQPDVGLPAPDLVLFMRVSPQLAASRGDYGAERYEKVDFQERVLAMFDRLKDSKWEEIDGTQNVEELQAEIAELVTKQIPDITASNLSYLWTENAQSSSSDTSPLSHSNDEDGNSSEEESGSRPSPR